MYKKCTCASYNKHDNENNTTSNYKAGCHSQGFSETNVHQRLKVKKIVYLISFCQNLNLDFGLN